MKLISNLVGMALAGTLGYLAEPNLRQHLTGKPASPTHTADPGKVVPQLPGDSTSVDGEKLPSEPLPATPVIDSAIAPTPTPPPVPASSGQIAPAPQPVPAPLPISPPPIEAIAPMPTAEDAVIKLMKESIQSGKITEFKVTQVTGWRVADPETVEGVNYQIGIATYPAETVFGTRSLEAKALIKDGKVVRWIRPKSGLEIK